ncbi:MAG TPA: DUF6662 family protein [Alphaproteobacteria bacterium]|nr:DUF6662 family protein [Alphaproteobacteria bacterium]
MFDLVLCPRALCAALVLCLLTASTAGAARADEPVFGFIYTTDLLPQGQKEMEQWLTWRHQKAGGTYDQLENRTEFSYGVSDRFQLSGYLNYNWSRAFHNGPDGATTPPEQFSDYNVAPDGKFNATRFVGASVEGIYRVLSPYTDAVGLALLLEPTIGPNFKELEARAIVQKNFLDDRLILAANLTWAPEIRDLPANPYADPDSTDAHANTNIETDLNWGIGASYRFAPNWSFGWEFQNEREVNQWAIFSRKQWMGSAYYTGPTIHYGGETFFATFTAWEQLPWAKNYTDSSVIVGGRDYDVDFEKFRTRLKVGFYF